MIFRRQIVTQNRKQSIQPRGTFKQGGDDSSGSDTEVDDAEFLQSKIEREFYDANNEDQTNNDDGDGDDNDAADEEDDLINAYNDEDLEADEDLDETLGDAYVMSDGSDEGGSDLYASDAEKYENMEAFDFDHQSVASIDLDDDGGDDNDDNDEVDGEADAIADQLSIESRDKGVREYDGLEFMEGNQEQRDDEDQEEKKFQAAVARAEIAAIENMMAEDMEEDCHKEAQLNKHAEQEADDIEQLCMELDEIQLMEQGLALPQRLEHANYIPGRPGNLLGSDSESSKLCHGDTTTAQSSTETRNLKTASESSNSVKCMGQVNVECVSDESESDENDDFSDQCDFADNDDCDVSDASYDIE